MKLKEAGTRSRPTVGGVSLVQLSADGVTIAWPEAVAIVTQICELLIASGTQQFDPATTFIQPSGEVVVRTSRSGEADQSVAALGELLRAYLRDTPHPVPLQIIVAQATCTPPFYRSIAELAEAISYYSRSKPEDLARAVYERWRSDHSVPAPARAPVFHGLRTSVARMKQLVPRPKWMTPRAVSITTAIVLCIGVAGIAFAAGLGRSAAPALVAKISRANGHASAALMSRMDGAVELFKSRFGATASTRANSTVDPPTSRPAPRRRARPAARTPATLRTTPAREDMNRVDDAEMSPGSIPRAELVAPFTSHSPDAAAPNELRVYSAEDTDVAPPIPIEQMRPNRLPTVDRKQNTTAITIVVSEDGRVESAALARTPATFHDSVTATLNLSAVKAWRFRPASKTGWPVKYRTTVWLD